MYPRKFNVFLGPALAVDLQSTSLHTTSSNQMNQKKNGKGEFQFVL